MSMTNSFGLYNSDFSAVKFGFLNEVGFVAISPVFDKFRGKKPKKGMSMYDHDNRALFYLRQDEVAKLLMNWDKIASGEKTQEVVVDGGANNMTTKLTIGCGVFELDETAKGNKKKAAPFQIAIEKFDEYDPQADNEALESFIFQAKDEEREIALYLFKKWLDVMMNFVISGIARHISSYSTEDSGGKSGGFNKFNNARNNKPRFSRSSSTDSEDSADEEDESESSSPRSSFSRKRRFEGKSSPKRNISEDDTFADDDDIEKLDE